MKTTITLVILAIFVSCMNKNRPETELYTCMEKLYEEYSVDLGQHLDKLENYYISLGVLESNSAEAKINFLKCVVKDSLPEIPPRTNIDQLHKAIPQLPDDVNNCALRKISKSELNTIKQAKIVNYCQLAQKINGRITHKIAAQAQLMHLKEADLKHPYYRAHFLLELPLFYFSEQ